METARYHTPSWGSNIQVEIPSRKRLQISGLWIRQKWTPMPTTSKWTTSKEII